ncbi:phosphatase PAP2 family protein [Telluribacter sp. SYSU D00476]|uniref:phosphatase PAP2 family protein n=1 Tax=Telluribacter sp. SYSU D00476 TaxID=2811430 RepID=UPI001FF1FAA5|nr:phosphatase PAP2 family protein [Telluribacter sp. SYSU D00476]
MRQFIYRQWPFLLPFTILWLGVGGIQLFHTQSDIIISINNFWSPMGDFLFKYGTHLGDGIFVVAVALLLMLYSYRRGLLIVLGYLISGLIVQVCKHFIFADIHRPWYTMSKVAPWLHKVEGVQMYQNGSFPSGHTTSAFALFAMLAFMSREPWVKALYLLPAVVVGYSRMYLLQHFLIDVHVGSMLGVVSSILLYYYFEEYWKAHPKTWNQRGLLS